MKRFPLLPLTLLGLIPTQAQAQKTLPGLPAPLPHVQNLENLEGKTLLLKSVHCQAPGRPDTEGRLYLSVLPGKRVRAARLEYNDQGKYVLETGQSAPKVKKYFDKYIYQQQEFSTFTLNTLVGLWRVFGMRFNLENVDYACQLS